MRITTSFPARRVLALVAVASLGLLSACGSDTTSAASGTSGTGEGDAAQVAAAQKVVDEFLAPPTAINQTVPLDGPVPGKGRTYVFLQCELEQCKLIGDGARAAAEAIGWVPKTIPYTTADPATLTSAMKQALQYDPIVVSPTGFPQAVWGTPEIIEAYEEAGTLIVPVSVANLDISETVPGGASTGADYEKGGNIIANWFIADSKGEGTALVVDVPVYEVMKAMGDSLESTVAEACSGCTTKSLDITLPQLSSGATNPAIVAAIQKDPSIKYVLATNGAFIGGLSAALKASNMTDVKIAGASATVNNQQALLDGTEHAWAAEPILQNGWIVMDIAARALLGMDVPEGDGGRPVQLLTQDNIEKPTESLDAPSDYRAQYLKLWGLS